MAASITIRVCTGAGAAAMSGAQTGIDFISADNATNSLANRLANLLTIPAIGYTYSFEKWVRARVDAAPDNGVLNFRVWTDGTVQAGLTLFTGVTSTGQTPVNTASSHATVDGTTYVEGSKLDWHLTTMTNVGDLTDFLVLQYRVGSGAAAGNAQQEYIYYQYDEM